LATLTGLNVPIGHDVQVIHATASQVQQTSTQKLRGVLDNLLQPARTRIDRPREQDGNSPAILAEINCLRAERGEPPLDGPSDTPPRGAMDEE
jgi:hypothetical protein